MTARARGAASALALCLACGARPPVVPVARTGDAGDTRKASEAREEGGDAIAQAAPRRLRSVLIYDPIGPGLDHASAIPAFDPSLGAAAAPTALRERFEIRDRPAALGLPAGPVRLLERPPDGSLAPLGEAARATGFATVADRIAPGLVGHRERRGWARDDDQRRFTEEFLVTIDNARPRPVEVVIREHLYRGQNWTLAYHSIAAVKEAPQQIALRATVPANGRAKVLYVVVYTW